MKLTKKLFSLVLAISLVAMLSVTAFAIESRYIGAPDAYSYLSISGEKATMYSEMTGNSQITKIVMTQVLQKDTGSGFKNVSGTTKTKTFYGNSGTMQNTVSCNGSGSYRVKTTYKISTATETETHTGYSNEVDH